MEMVRDRIPYWFHGARMQVQTYNTFPKWYLRFPIRDPKADNGKCERRAL